jgi:hypothetical protein
MPDGVKSLGHWAFTRSKIKAIRLSLSIDRLSGLTFYGCQDLERLIICTSNYFHFAAGSLDRTGPIRGAREGPPSPI